MTLPVPYHDADGVTLYHGDCREILPLLRAEALVTDPPFGIRFDQATWTDDPATYPALMAWLVETARTVVPLGWL